MQHKSLKKSKARNRKILRKSIQNDQCWNINTKWSMLKYQRKITGLKKEKKKIIIWATSQKDQVTYKVNKITSSLGFLKEVFYPRRNEESCLGSSREENVGQQCLF